MIPSLHLVNPLAAGAVAAVDGGIGFPHRYWRFISPSTVGGSAFALEPSEWTLFSNGVEVGSTATISMTAGVFGPDSAMTDGNLSNRKTWLGSGPSDYTAGSWFYKLVFASEILIDGMKHGQFDTANQNLNGFTLQYSDDDSNWFTHSVKSGIAQPGANNTLSSLIALP